MDRISSAVRDLLHADWFTGVVDGVTGYVREKQSSNLTPKNDHIFSGHILIVFLFSTNVRPIILVNTCFGPGLDCFFTHVICDTFEQYCTYSVDTVAARQTKLACHAFRGS